MWRRSLSRPGSCGPARLQPVLARHAALPRARGEAEDLHLHAAALQGARQHVGADRGDGDRAAPHRAGIVEQERDAGVAELGVALHLEAERRGGRGDDAGEAAGVEDALLQVELPGAVLLRLQPPLQLVGQPRDGALERVELLVEIGAQAFQLGRLGQVRRADDLVMAVVKTGVVRIGVGDGRRGRRGPSPRRCRGPPPLRRAS